MSGSLSSAGKNILHSASPLETETERREKLKIELLRNRAAGRQRLVTDPWGRVVGKDTAVLDQQIAERGEAEAQRKRANDVRCLISNNNLSIRGITKQNTLFVFF